MRTIINQLVTWIGIHELNREEKKELITDTAIIICALFAFYGFFSVVGI